MTSSCILGPVSGAVVGQSAVYNQLAVWKFPYCLFLCMNERLFWLPSILLCPHSKLISLFQQFYMILDTILINEFFFAELSMVVCVWNVTYQYYLFLDINNSRYVFSKKYFKIRFLSFSVSHII